MGGSYGGGKNYPGAEGLLNPHKPVDTQKKVGEPQKPDLVAKVASVEGSLEPGNVRLEIILEKNPLGFDKVIISGACPPIQAGQTVRLPRDAYVKLSEQKVQAYMIEVVNEESKKPVALYSWR